MHRLAPLAILAACGQPSRPTTSSPSQVASAPTPYSFDFLPADLRERGPSLIDIQCPAGTKRVETSSYGRTHRHCETPTKEYEGPIVEFAEGEIRLRGTHAGYRSGIEISANAGGVIEAEYAANHPVGRYRYRKGSIVVAEGAFDSEGRLDGEWIFRAPVSGQELTRTTFTHGTGSIEIWDWRGSQPKVAARLQCKDGLLDGAQMFHLLSAPATYDHRVDGEYRRGLPDGAWKLTREKDNVILYSGAYSAGTPTGTWHVIAEHPCIAQMRGGDTVDCIYGKDLPYTCTDRGGCKFDSKPVIPHSGADIEPVDDDALIAPRAVRNAKRCELGEPYLSS